MPQPQFADRRWPRTLTSPRAGRSPIRSVLLAAALALAGCAPAEPPVQDSVDAAVQTTPTEAIVVYLVRHSERAEDGTNDPPISGEGELRANQVAELLQDAGITHVHTTNFKRTRATGEPSATAAGLTMELYDPGNLEGFAQLLWDTPGRHLVLGHSNTTHDLVAALGGDPVSPIEEMEYDRLYIVTLHAGGASTVLLRFGTPYEG